VATDSLTANLEEVGIINLTRVDMDGEPLLSFLELIHEASGVEAFSRQVGLPLDLDLMAIRDQVEGYRGLIWTIVSEKEKVPVGLYACQPEPEYPIPGCEKYWQVSPFVFEPFRGMGIIYHTITFMHQELISRQIPGSLAFTWESDHSQTRLWRKLGYQFLGRTWIAGETTQGWKLVWSKTFSS